MQIQVRWSSCVCVWLIEKRSLGGLNKCCLVLATYENLVRKTTQFKA